MRVSLCIVIILSLLITGCSQGTQTAQAQVVNNKSLAIDSNEPKAKDAKQESLKQEASQVVYDIKGTSTKFTQKEKSSNDKWKAEIAQISRDSQGTVIINGNVSDKLVALTFDDGPDKVITPKILDILKSHEVHANFFFLGESAERYPLVVKKAFEEGNLVLNHGFDHPEFTNKTEEFINLEFQRTGEILKNIIGVTPTLVRPPYGIVNENVLKVAKAQGYKLVLWSTDTFDWSQRDENSIVSNIVNNVRPGEIILMHSNSDKEATAEALPAIIKGLHENGYKIVTLDLLLKNDAYYSN